MPTPIQLQALQGLKSMQAQPYKPQIDSSQSDPNSQLYQLQDARKGELEDRAAANIGAAGASQTREEAAPYAGEVDRVKSLLGPLNQDLASNPLNRQMDEVNDYHDKERSAILAGFGGGSQQSGPDQNQYQNPIQAQTAYGRQAEQDKINMPLKVAQTQAGGNVEAQRIQSAGNLDVANSKGAQMEQMIQSAIGTGKPIHSVTGSGGFSFETPRGPAAVPPQIQNAIVKARQDYENSKNSLSMFDVTGSGKALVSTRKAALDQAISAGINEYPASHPSLKVWVQGVLNDPSTENETLEQILAKNPESAAGLSPDEKLELQQMLNLFRGH